VDSCALKCSTALSSISKAATCSNTIGASLYCMYALKACPSLWDFSKAYGGEERTIVWG
jgi:hypothetical protein